MTLARPADLSGAARPRLSNRSRPWHSRLLPACALCCAAVCLFAAAATTGAAESPPSLPILARYLLPTSPTLSFDVPLNVRWADDQSVYLSRLHSGVSQIALDPKLTLLHEIFPDRLKMGHFTSFDSLGVSTGSIAVASIGQLGWRRLRSSDPRFLIVTSRLGHVDDIDLSSSKLAVLGSPELTVPFSGGALWLGPLGAHPAEELKPVLRDDPELDRLQNCTTLGMGHVRFLDDGDLVVVPAFEPGAYLLDAEGRQLRRWDGATLGIDDCGQVQHDLSLKIGVDHPLRFAWLNRHTVVDAILPLQRGPGLVIRSVRGGKVHWEMKVLEPARVSTFEIPLTGELPYDRLRGDVRGDRIVLLLSEHGVETGRPARASQLVLLGAPALPSSAGADR